MKFFFVQSQSINCIFNVNKNSVWKLCSIDQKRKFFFLFLIQFSAITFVQKIVLKIKWFIGKIQKWVITIVLSADQLCFFLSCIHFQVNDKICCSSFLSLVSYHFLVAKNNQNICCWKQLWLHFFPYLFFFFF